MTNINLTPFERAALNKTIHTARMTLCESVQEMVLTLIDLRNMIDDSQRPPKTDMYDDAMISEMIKEEAELMSTLTKIADLLEEQGVSA
tara:strand:+ start:255 stop:521 length:267 start_codon:yes stop_codon:yes gene_type:complete